MHAQCRKGSVSIKKSAASTAPPPSVLLSRGPDSFEHDAMASFVRLTVRSVRKLAASLGVSPADLVSDDFSPAAVLLMWRRARGRTPSERLSVRATTLSSLMILNRKTPLMPLRRAEREALSRQAAAVTLFETLSPAQQLRDLRDLWRLVPASQRMAPALADARRFAPSTPIQRGMRGTFLKPTAPKGGAR